MRLQLAFFAAAAVACSASAAGAASVDIRDAVARVTVVPEDRADIKVEIIAPNARLPLSVRTFGDQTIVDGDLHHRIRNCNGSGEHARIRVRDVGEVRYADMPQIVVHTPRAVVVSANGAVQGAVGRSGSLDLHDSGCSAWTVADVAGAARIQSSGAGSVRMGQSSRLDIQLSGAANIHATRVREALDARLSGAGNVRVDEVSGEMDARVSGVGSIQVANGRDTAVRASVSGVGGVEFGGVASSLQASVSGMGHIEIKQVNGPISKSVSGIGHVTIGD